MFAELPKLFDRNFAIGYLLPGLLAVTACAGLLQAVDLVPQKLADLVSENFWERSTLASFLVLLFALLLLVTNYGIIVLLEGYGTLNPARLFACVDRNRYHAPLRKSASSKSTANPSKTERSSSRRNFASASSKRIKRG